MYLSERIKGTALIFRDTHNPHYSRLFAHSDQIISLFVSIFLPAVTTSMYFYNPAAASIEAVETGGHTDSQSPSTRHKNGHPSIPLNSFGSSSKPIEWNGEHGNPPESINNESVVPSDVNANNVAEGGAVVHRGGRGNSKSGTLILICNLMGHL